MIILESKWFCRLFKIRGIALYPFIIVNDKTNNILLNHESIHIAQQKELYIFKFYYLYIKQYLQNLKIYKDHWIAYYNIKFEKEAFYNEDDFTYLKTREKYSYKKY
jgi:hypothetical protein